MLKCPNMVVTGFGELADVFIEAEVTVEIYTEVFDSFGDRYNGTSNSDGGAGVSK